MSDSSASRRGGREARRSLRASPLADNVRPVWPGMEGGHYKGLSETDVLKVHHMALRLLAGEPFDIESARALRGSGWEGDLDELRAGRG